MSTITRKKFIQTGGLASASLLVPQFLQSLGNQFVLGEQRSDNKLIVIQMSGGNDGLNTFIPYSNDAYYSLRPDIAIPKEDVLRVTSDMGFHPSMKPLVDLFHSGELAVINSAGYPNPDHSHFRSMDIWTSASGSQDFIETGWIGRMLDSMCSGGCQSHLALETDDLLGRALKGKTVKGISTGNPDRLYRAAHDPFTAALSKPGSSILASDDNRAYLYKTLAESSSSIEYLYKQARIYKAKTVFPGTPFGNRMKLISELICSGCETRVYYISLSGFDTHANQSPVQSRLLEMLSETLVALSTELKLNNRFGNTLVMGFSEFGRRVKQNGSKGTDHGEGNNMILLGGSLRKKGFLNAPPNLDELTDGNVRFQTDFRNVYATVLTNWFGLDHKPILGSAFETLNFI